ncbi:hypothetical protein [Polymorphobacter megasporae]|uniref:hypothetical protein n=1 Tax=Glacieibacterium megasporae TaxID=2835787 RepID=UPI001C1E652C|nr:hypothetical protein [Polymorphobacter megasporae]UAJ09168.1 hypothetical protein KTC28_12555 [Polymorphobacter megasporae]
MPLNEELSWSQVGAIVTNADISPPGTVSDAFQLAYGMPTKELLPAGMSLYKFNGWNSLGQGAITAGTELSPWWSPTAPFKHDAGLVQRQKIADANGVSFREWGRLTSVIKENWSSLDWLLTVQLAVPVYAWFGGFKGMARIDKDTQSRRNAALEKRGAGSNLPGGGTQFYIPNLTVGAIVSPAFRSLGA